MANRSKQGRSLLRWGDREVEALFLRLGADSTEDGHGGDDVLGFWGDFLQVGRVNGSYVCNGFLEGDQCHRASGYGDTLDGALLDCEEAVLAHVAEVRARANVIRRRIRSMRRKIGQVTQ